jgi:drug/metabolite transporter (DMT)-like permease
MMWLGAAIALAAAVSNAFALMLQGSEARTAHQSEAQLSLLLRLARRPRWVLGTALVALAWPLQVLALAFAPIAVVQPMLATFQLILMAIVAIGRRVALHARQWVAAVATVVGVGMIVGFSPHRTVDHPAAWRLAVPLVVIGVAALVAFGAARRRWRGIDTGLMLAVGAGLGYAWVDFADKLLSNEISVGRWSGALIWLLAVVGFGVLAFLQENSALQYRSPVVVAPVIGARAASSCGPAVSVVCSRSRSVCCWWASGPSCWRAHPTLRSWRTGNRGFPQSGRGQVLTCRLLGQTHSLGDSL